MPRSSRFRSASLLVSLLVAPDASGFELAAFATDEFGALAVAIASDGRSAAGDGRGVWLRSASGSLRHLDLDGATRDLALAPDGSLWIASDAGLYRFHDGRVALRTPAPGELARNVRRVSADATGVAVVTAAGVFFAADGERFARVEVPVGEAGASAVAIEATTAGAVLWIGSERGLFRAAGARARAERVALPIDLRPVLDVSVRGGRILALAPTFLAERSADGSWSTARPALPPGSIPIRVEASEQAVWIATDRGLLTAPAAAARFERADEPAGTAPAKDVAVAGERVLVATSRGVLIDDGLAISLPRPAARATAACDPPIRSVQVAALDHLRLSGDLAAGMRRGVRWRSLLPLVSVEGREGRDEDDRRSHDEAFISGGYRRLQDDDEVRARVREIALRLTWDLGDAAYNPEQIDVSTETRRLIELRDDVLDELNQLYFDRQRALAVAADSADAPERERLRAEELAAGLDAWTDGWFGRTATCAISSASPPR